MVHVQCPRSNMMKKCYVFWSKSLIYTSIHLRFTHIELLLVNINPDSSNFTQIFNPHNISSTLTSRVQVYFLGIIRDNKT